MAKKVLPKKLHKDFHTFNQEGNIEGLKFLFEDNNIDINGMLFRPDEYSKYNHYIFLEIFKDNNIPEKLEFFISKGVDLSLTGHNGKNALGHIYVHERYYKALEKLIEAGLDLNHKDDDGCTFLYHLVRNFGDKTELDDDGDEVPRSTEDFQLALKFIELALKHGADPDIKNNYDTSPRDWVVHRKEEKLAGETDIALEKLLNNFETK